MIQIFEKEKIVPLTWSIGELFPEFRGEINILLVSGAEMNWLSDLFTNLPIFKMENDVPRTVYTGETARFIYLNMFAQFGRSEDVEM